MTNNHLRIGTESFHEVGFQALEKLQFARTATQLLQGTQVDLRRQSRGHRDSHSRFGIGTRTQVSVRTDTRTRQDWCGRGSNLDFVLLKIKAQVLQDTSQRRSELLQRHFLPLQFATKIVQNRRRRVLQHLGIKGLPLLERELERDLLGGARNHLPGGKFKDQAIVP